jgi:hypothetical protein
VLVIRNLVHQIGGERMFPLVPIGIAAAAWLLLRRVSEQKRIDRDPRRPMPPPDGMGVREPRVPLNVAPAGSAAEPLPYT